MSRVLVLVLLAAAVAGGLAGCGRKGALEPPPKSALVEQPAPRAA